MIEPLIVLIITILIAPFMFWFLSHKVYKKNKAKKYPTQINDAIGDLIFLPVYNASLTQIILSTNQTTNTTTAIISIILGLILTITYVIYQKNISSYIDWSKPKKGTLNFGGYYHATYMFLQASIVFYGTITNPLSILLILPLIGYLTTTIMQYLSKGYI